MMKFNRQSMTRGLVGFGLVGALVSGGVVAAQAATGEGPVPQSGSTISPTAVDRAVGHMAGMGFGEHSPMTAVADYLGLTLTALQEQLQSGQSLADVAATQGKSVSGLEDAMIAALETNLDANSILTPDQKVAALDQLKSRIDAMVNNTAAEMGVGMGMGNGTGGEMGMHSGAGQHDSPGMGAGMAATTR